MTDATTTRASGPGFVFLHGLTFDHHMWDAAVAGLPAGARVLVPDLPGHGGAPPLESHRAEDIVARVHDAVLRAGLDAPVMVGHSLGALLATAYAARHPVAAIVNVDQPLAPPAPFLRGVLAHEAQLRGPGFDEVWAMFQASMHIERVPSELRGLLRAGERASQDVVLTYWADVFELGVDALVELLDDTLEAVRRSGVRYVAVYGDPITSELLAWVGERLPAAEIHVWPVGHHFPHLAHADRFAGVLRDVGTSVSPRPQGRAAIPVGGP
jgi:pimeloyl-ACP methyl ester carboxylesterase